MIITRNVFKLKFGKAAEAAELIREGKKIASDQGLRFGRVLADVTGPSYTLILENESESLADFENELKKVFSNEEWKKWYKKFVPLVESGHRDIFRVIE
ncbi:MAG: hypothetical protein JSS91_00575 [Bacteroidetes bacterium]|nr:hypothetical protein [Bacteroidota bacterium]